MIDWRVAGGLMGRSFRRSFLRGLVRVTGGLVVFVLLLIGAIASDDGDRPAERSSSSDAADEHRAAAPPDRDEPGAQILRTCVLRAEPSSTSRKLATIRGGATLSIVERRRGWRRVATAAGEEGWTGPTCWNVAAPSSTAPAAARVADDVLLDPYSDGAAPDVPPPDAPRSGPATVREPRSLRSTSAPTRACCKVCRTGCPCGDSCISCTKTCRVGGGCAC